MNGLPARNAAVRPVHRRRTHLDEHVVLPGRGLLDVGDPHHVRRAVSDVHGGLHVAINIVRRTFGRQPSVQSGRGPSLETTFISDPAGGTSVPVTAREGVPRPTPPPSSRPAYGWRRPACGRSRRGSPSRSLRTGTGSARWNGCSAPRIGAPGSRARVGVRWYPVTRDPPPPAVSARGREILEQGTGWRRCDNGIAAARGSGDDRLFRGPRGSRPSAGSPQLRRTGRASGMGRTRGSTA